MTPLAHGEAASHLGSGNVHASWRRSRCTVSLDLRVPGQAAAVAVGKAGAVAAWARVAGEDDPVALAKLAIEKLRVHPTALRVLLGWEDVQVGVFSGAGIPKESDITETLLAEGYERLVEPAVATVSVSRGTWLVAACGQDTVYPLAEGLSELVVAETVFVVDQLLAVGGLEVGSALAELGETGLLVVVMTHEWVPVVRSVPSADARQAAHEVLKTAGREVMVQVIGAERAALGRSLAENGFEIEKEPLPVCGPQALPAELELAWKLALDPDPPNLDAPQLAKRRTSLLWARRVMRAALVLGLLGALLVAVGLRSSWVSRAENKALRTEASELEQQVEQLKETSALAEKVRRLRAELAGKTPPWPRVAVMVASLGRALPPGVGWERLAIVDGTLELETSATGSTPFQELELMRRTLERFPGIVNLSWEEPMTSAGRIVVRQVFRAKIRPTAPASSPPISPEGAVQRQGAP